MFLIAGLIAAGASIVSSLIGASSAQSAAETQASAAEAGVAAVKEGTKTGADALNASTTAGVNAITASTASGVNAAQAGLSQMQAALEPYMTAGSKAVASQSDLAGLNGADAQQKAIDALSSGSEFNSLVKSGEDAMLQNSAATGGLRGGNLQGALAQYRPQMLTNLINQQYSRLGGISQLGQQSASQYGAGAIQTAGQVAGLYGAQGSGQAALYGQQGQSLASLYGQEGASIANLLAAKGQAQANGQIAQGQAWNAIPNAITSGLGVYTGLQGYGQSGSGGQYNYQNTAPGGGNY